MSSSKVGRCKLCQREGSLLDSHLIPAFVSRWVKQTSATGFMRGFEEPNVRKQDFPTLPLLCSDCEQRFSSSEKKFAEAIFFPCHEGRTRFAYEEWLLYFAASLGWRCLVASNREGLQDHPQHVAPVDAARDIWADFLLGRREGVGPYRFNLFFTPVGGWSTAKVPDGLNWYFRNADMTPVFSRTRAATYAKLPGMFFWTSIVPPDPGGWKRTRITRRGTIRSKQQIISDGAVGEFLMHRADTIFKKINDLSPTQKQRIEDAVRRNPDRAATSGSFEAWLQDERIRIENRFKS
jgi:hypothetical protein